MRDKCGMLCRDLPRLFPGTAGRSVRIDVADDDTGDLGVCFYILAFFSFLIIIFLFPLSLLWSVKVSAHARIDTIKYL